MILVDFLEQQENKRAIPHYSGIRKEQVRIVVIGEEVLELRQRSRVPLLARFPSTKFLGAGPALMQYKH